MPKNRTQRIVFGIIMSYAMAYGMEVYNVAIREGVNLTPGGDTGGSGRKAKHCDPEKDNPYICRLLRQAGTIAVMCPAMSLVASILYNIIMDGMPVTKLPLSGSEHLLKISR